MLRAVPYSDDAAALQVTLHEPDARLHHVPEAVLQDIWRRLDFDTRNIATVDGQPVEIITPGKINRDGGPDFRDAQLRIGLFDWYGDVEIHRTSGEWLLHRHNEDERYDRVVLHVTLAPDRHTGKLRRADRSSLPEIVVLPHLNASLRSLLFRFFANPDPSFPCASQWADVPAKIRRPWLRMLGQERLRSRLSSLSKGLGETRALDEVLYRATMRCLGYAPNAEAMETLARRVPLRRLRKLSHRRDAEALLLGAAGLLPDPATLPPGDADTAAYVHGLWDRFQRMPESDRPTMNASAWQFARLRPVNSPARRIAQAAAMVAPGGLLNHEPVAELAEALTTKRPLKSLRHLLMSVMPDPYWQTHTRPERRSREMAVGIGRSRADDILLNAIFPVLLHRAAQAGDYESEDRVLDLISSLPPADDRVTRLFADNGAGAGDALEAQGLQQLLGTRCHQGRCLSCTVGRWLLGR